MIPGSLGALDGGYVGFFGAFGLAGALGLSYTLIRQLREAVWALFGYVWLASLRARPFPRPDRRVTRVVALRQRAVLHSRGCSGAASARHADPIGGPL